MAKSKAKEPKVSEPAKKIRMVIAELGWSDREFGRRVGMDSGNVSRLLNGVRSLDMRMNPEMPLVIAEQLGVRPDWLWRGQGPRKVIGMANAPKDPRARAEWLAHEDGISEESIAAVLLETVGQALPASELLQRMALHARRPPQSERKAETA